MKKLTEIKLRQEFQGNSRKRNTTEPGGHTPDPVHLTPGNSGPGSLDIDQTSPLVEEWRQITRFLDVSSEQGLSEQEARARRSKYGPNQLRRMKTPGAVHILLRQFQSLIVLLLIIATGVALVFSEYIDAIAKWRQQEWRPETFLEDEPANC